MHFKRDDAKLSPSESSKSEFTPKSPTSLRSSTSAPNLLLGVSTFSRNALTDTDRDGTTVEQRQLSTVNGKFVANVGADSRPTPPDRLTSPTSLNIRSWQQVLDDRKAADQMVTSLCKENTDLIDVIEEGENFQEHSHIDHFIATINNINATIRRRNKDHRNVRRHSCLALGPGRVDYGAILSKQAKELEVNDVSHDQYTSQMREFYRVQEEEFQKLTSFIVPFSVK